MNLCFINCTHIYEIYFFKREDFSYEKKNFEGLICFTAES